jgi:hypothetical protein
MKGKSVMSKLTVEVIVPEGLKPGDKFQVEIETPTVEKKPRGQLAGLTLEQMTIEQLKREVLELEAAVAARSTG